MNFYFAAFLALQPLLASASGNAPQQALRGQNGSPDSAPNTKSDSVGRVLSTEVEPFHALMCNSELSDDDCDPASTRYSGTLSNLINSTPQGEQAVVPCGTCAVVDTTDGSIVDLPDGINVVGMLHFPSTSNLTVVTTHIVVQGVLKMDPPNSALGNKVRIQMVGSDDHYLHPHPENSLSCDEATGCLLGKKVIAVAGGRLDIRGLEDDTCPSWTKLQSIIPPSGVAETTGCELDHDLTVGDGSFTSADVGTWPSGWFLHHGGSTGSLTVVQDAEDGNKYLRQAERCCWFSGFGIAFNTHCADPPSNSNNKGMYRFRIRYRSHALPDTDYVNKSPYLQLAPGGNVGRCPAAIDEEWVVCERIIVLSEAATNGSSASLKFSAEIHPSKTIDYDDVMFEAVPYSYEVKVSNPDAARCWGQNDEILVTNSQSSGGWSDQVVSTLHSVDASNGKLTFQQTDSIGNPRSLDDDINMASEVASLSRPIIFEAEGDGPSDNIYDSLHGGHLKILRTPNIAQHIEGVEIRNFGQQGILGRYPIHFHMSGSVTGSIIRKNVIRESKQRCIVIHGSHDVMVEDNVAFDSYGHCYILEDGGEHGNTFQNNLGARTRLQGISIGSTDHKASTLWITNPMNHFIGNVCAGSQNFGLWFELRMIRGDSAELPENDGINPNRLPLYTFRNNTAHSNVGRGMTTYFKGYCPESEALFEGITSYQNRIGLFIHGTCNVKVKDGYFGYNRGMGYLYFGNGMHNTIESSTFVGGCGQNGITLSLEERGQQIEVYSSSFIGFTDDCGGAAIRISGVQADSTYDMPILSNLTFDSNNYDAINIGEPLAGRNIFIEDHDGTMNPSGSPGFYVNDIRHMTTFLNSDLCRKAGDYGLFCKNTCLRRIFVHTGGCCSKKFERPELDYQMVVTSKTNSSKFFTYDKYMRKAGNWYHATWFDVVLPLDDYRVHFLSIPDGQVMVPPVRFKFDDEINLDSPPSCDYITAASIEFACPPDSVLQTDGISCI